MSHADVMITCSSNDAAQRPPAGNQRRKERRFHRKMQNLEKNRNLEGKYKHNHRMGQSKHHQAPPQQNGASAKDPSFHWPTSTHNASLPRPGSAASASHSSSKPSASTHSLPSLTATVSRGSPGRPSASSGLQPAAAQTSARVPTKFLALDCEMVGSGPKGSTSQLARCSMVSYDGDVIYDKFINPSVPVTDYRTRWSGIRRRDLINAMPYSEARKEILRMLMGKVVIGHAIHNDFKVLGYSHPAALTRDTSRIPLLNLKAGFAVGECASLKRLTKAILRRDIQTGRKGHSSVEDAKATMELYKVVEEEWERELASRSQASYCGNKASVN
ncbi:interferon-stimulated 20 kDa exonuclease-like 2 [Chaetodon trifascialis]|uniref:interferon-stimulated 20 kDa exonuclease-like 2 n=1 Tax=Chaetodon trifascialis TaxID=109706 RepID=UPI003994BCAB